MRISDNIKDAVCFLCSKKGVASESTAFFVGLPYQSKSGIYHHYLVTAKHNVVDNHGKLPAKLSLPLYARVNLRQGGIEHLTLENEWVQSDDPAVDAVVLPLDSIPDEVKVDPVYLDQCVTENLLNKMTEAERMIIGFYADTGRDPGGGPSFRIGIGDEIVIVGLFTLREGTEINIPIAREGIIAAMPEENIYDPDKRQSFSAYLVEVRSIGGLSGSPVWVSIPAGRVRAYEPDVRTNSQQLYLLGLIRGHWRLNRNERKTMDKLNTGIATVTPFLEVVTILNKKELKSRREETERRERTQSK